MKVVNISLDPKVLDSNSAASYRNRQYGTIVDAYRVVVHDKKDSKLELTDRVTIYGVGGSTKVVRLLRVALLLRRLVKEGKCDVITSSDPYYFGMVAYIVARLYHVGFEVHILGIEKLNPIRRMIARFFIRHASAVRVNSTRLRERVAKEFNVPWEEIAFVPIHVPTESLGFKLGTPGTDTRQTQDLFDTAFKKEYGENFNFLFVGRLVQVKNIPMQLRAMAQLVKEYPHARLHIVGEGPQEQEVRVQIHNLGLRKHVILHGRKTGLELGTYYRMADCFMLTSFAEGWPMVIFEAITAGVPVIMTDVGCAGEMIKNNENGLVVPVDDSNALAVAMGRVMSEEGLRARLRETATERIKNYWPLDKILAGYKQSWQKAYDHKL